MKRIKIKIYAKDYEDLNEQVNELVRHTGCIPTSCVLEALPIEDVPGVSMVEVHTAFGPIYCISRVPGKKQIDKLSAERDYWKERCETARMLLKKYEDD